MRTILFCRFEYQEQFQAWHTQRFGLPSPARFKPGACLVAIHGDRQNDRKGKNGRNDWMHSEIDPWLGRFEKSNSRQALMRDQLNHAEPAHENEIGQPADDLPDQGDKDQHAQFCSLRALQIAHLVCSNESKTVANFQYEYSHSMQGWQFSTFD